LISKTFSAICIVSLVGFVPHGVTSAVPACTIVGTPANDTLRGTANNDVICGLGGDDYIDGGAGDDLILGGTGHDLIYGGLGTDTLFGDRGRDTLSGDEEPDRLNGGPGNDSIDGGDGQDTINGNADSDQLFGGEGSDTFSGGTGQDWIDGGPGDDQMDGGAEHDWFNGWAGRDRVNDSLGPNHCQVALTEVRRSCIDDNRPSSVGDIRFSQANLDVSLVGQDQMLFIDGVDAGSGITTIQILLTGRVTNAPIVLTLYAWNECDGRDEDPADTVSWSCRINGSVFSGRYKMHFKVLNSFFEDEYTVTEIEIVDGSAGITTIYSPGIIGTDLEAGFSVVNSCLQPGSLARPKGC